VAGVLVGALVVAGCQRQMSAADYVEAVDAAAVSVAAAMQQLEDTTVSPPSQSDLAEVAKGFEDAAERLRSIEPPERAEQAHKRLTSATLDAADSVERLADALQRAPSDDDRLALLIQWERRPETARVFRRMTSALEQLEQAGYDVTPEA
jgi:hypothetical protein